ncbi:MAG: HD domain-containing protein [Deltaproteobacteria bacterium]|nr:MAG: HD domain-containing protein [Deltaproteobacteria bacterium]
MTISALQPGDRPDDLLVLLTGQRSGTTRSGSTFLTVTLQDSTGQLTGRIWSPETICPQGLSSPAPVRVTGRVETFREERQLNVDAIRAVEASPAEMQQLVPASHWSAEVLEAAIRSHVVQHTRADGPVRRLLEHLLAAPDIGGRFFTVAAAAANHHAYWSGLAEHTLSMLRTAALLQAHYERYYPGMLDGELLVAGVLLHDMGKVWEFEAGPVPAYSTAGRLVGHIPMMAARLERAAVELGDVPEALIVEVQHLVLAHHGEYEYGSPRRPKTAEAQLLHYIDQIDAKMNVFAGLEPGAGWSPFHRTMGRPLLRAEEMRESWRPAPQPAALPAEGPGLVLRAGHDETGGVASREPGPTGAGGGGSEREKRSREDATISLFDGLGDS